MNVRDKTTGPAFFDPLESLRGVAALVVVIFHATWTNPVSSLRFMQNGPLMVDFFFVLSGFVIFHSYGAKLAGIRDVMRFLWLRLGRLYPLHLAFLLVFLAFEVAKLVAQQRFGIVADKPAFTVNNGHAFVANLLLVQSLNLFPSLTFNYPSWSVSTEFYAYVVFAIVRCLWPQNNRFVYAALLIIAGSFAVLIREGCIPLTAAGFQWGFFRCCGGFFIGALTYCIYAQQRGNAGHSRARHQHGWLSASVVVITVCVLATIDPNGKWTYLLPVLSAAVVLTVVLWPQRMLESLLCSTPLRWLGRISYSLYMVHAAVVWVFVQTLTVLLRVPKFETADGLEVATGWGAGLLVLLFYLAAVLALSNVTYRWIEDPFRRRARHLADRWFSEGGQTLASRAR